MPVKIEFGSCQRPTLFK